MTIINTYRQQNDTVPSSQLRRLGLVYSSYRLVVNVFYLILAYANANADNLLLPSLLQQTALIFYTLLSIILLGLFYVVRKRPQRQLGFGLVVDIIMLSLLLYSSGAPDLQLTMLYMVVVAASFMLLPGSQALVITLLAVIFVIYQQFFYALSSSISLTNLGDALLMSASFLVVGFLSWTISQRLLHVEKVSAQQAKEVERLNDINQEVISQMVNGVIVLDQQQVVLANRATYQLLGILEKNHELENFQQQLAHLHAQLLKTCLAVPAGQSRLFTYELPTTIEASIVARLRVQITPLKDYSRLIILEDLRREQASAQQLKLASLGQLTASIAHEIRNPLSAISQASQLLMEEVDEQAVNNVDTAASNSVDDGNHELYKMIFSQTKRVNRIIEDVLKLSKRQPPNKHSIALERWMVEFIANHFSGHDVFLSGTVQPLIVFDTHQLEQILINLINNGLRYSSLSHPHAYAEVEIYSRRNDVIIDVLDNGKGVKSADIEHLFEPFFTTDKAGTGLGLYLSQAFSEANQARLVYVPEHKKTCFRLIIPAILTEQGMVESSSL
ncbi:sensor histidine kinase [Psychrobacter sp. 1U2]|uniref:sensor histidine kinase n=1 Tax=Psychrobacter sp. 1U2 TaxID=3453577 RepID=UPI003F474EBF